LNELKNQVALVTGSTRGIGRAIATALARRGAMVIVHGRRIGRVDEAVDEMRAELGPDGPAIRGVAGELGVPEGVVDVCAQVRAYSAAGVDILVNNAGMYERVPASEISYEAWEAMLAVNVLSGDRLTQQFTPDMIARERGCIVFVASESGVHIPADMIHYGVSKAAQIALSSGWARVLAGTGVTCNAILPGLTRTEGNVAQVARWVHNGVVAGAQAGYDRIAASRPPAHRPGWANPADVAEWVAYLASPAGRIVTGAAINLSGGMIGTVTP
jgi:NAD(P)-dependent dehydrogenase (short-subunit alcohol dehydrogenase family)